METKIHDPVVSTRSEIVMGLFKALDIPTGNFMQATINFEPANVVTITVKCAVRASQFNNFMEEVKKYNLKAVQQ